MGLPEGSLKPGCRTTHAVCEGHSLSLEVGRRGAGGGGRKGALPGMYHPRPIWVAPLGSLGPWTGMRNSQRGVREKGSRCALKHKHEVPVTLPRRPALCWVICFWFCFVIIVLVHLGVFLVITTRKQRATKMGGKRTKQGDDDSSANLTRFPQTCPSC